MKTKIFAILLLGLVIFSSCDTMKYVSPPYTTVDKIIEVKGGMNIDQVNSALGIKPYDVYVIQEDGGSVLIYNYLRKNRKFEANMKMLTILKHQPEGLTKGEDWYDADNPSKIYVYFIDGKVVSLISDRGRADAAGLMIKQNQISLISKEKLTSLQSSSVVNTDGSQSKIVNLNSSTKDQSEKPKIDKKGTSSKKTLRILGVVLGIPLVIGLAVAAAGV